jgi:hypothetical protein
VLCVSAQVRDQIYFNFKQITILTSFKIFLYIPPFFYSYFSIYKITIPIYFHLQLFSLIGSCPSLSKHKITIPTDLVCFSFPLCFLLYVPSILGLPLMLPRTSFFFLILSAPDFCSVLGLPLLVSYIRFFFLYP